MLLVDEVEDRAAGLVVGLAQSPADLLQEHGGGLGRAEQQDRVDLGDVDPLGQEIHGEDDVELPGAQPPQRLLPLFLGGLGDQVRGGDPGVAEPPGHVDGMADPVAAPCPLQLGEVDVVRDPEVLERGEQLLVQRVPEPHLEGISIPEEPLDVVAVGPLGGGGQPEQDRRVEVVDQGLVGGRGGVVELVDDHHGEPLGIE